MANKSFEGRGAAENAVRSNLAKSTWFIILLYKNVRTAANTDPAPFTRDLVVFPRNENGQLRCQGCPPTGHSQSMRTISATGSQKSSHNSIFLVQGSYSRWARLMMGSRSGTTLVTTVLSRALPPSATCRSGALRMTFSA